MMQNYLNIPLKEKNYPRDIYLDIREINNAELNDEYLWFVRGSGDGSHLVNLGMLHEDLRNVYFGNSKDMTWGWYYHIKIIEKPSYSDEVQIKFAELKSNEAHVLLDKVQLKKE